MKKVKRILRKVKQSKRLQGALVLFIIISVLSGIGYGIYNKGKQNGSTTLKPTLNYQDIEELSFQESNITEVGRIVKPITVGKHEFNSKLTNSTYLFTYNAKIKAGYDLKDIHDDGGNETTQTITVTLPKPHLTEASLDEDSYKLYINDERVTANVDFDDIHNEKVRILKEAKKIAIDGGLYNKTSEHAKVVITDYIHSKKGYENYNVVFNEVKTDSNNKDEA